VALPVAAPGVALVVATPGKALPVAAPGVALPVVTPGKVLPVAVPGVALPVAMSGKALPVAAPGVALPLVTSGKMLAKALPSRFGGEEACEAIDTITATSTASSAVMRTDRRPIPPVVDPPRRTNIGKNGKDTST
jgi:hypothetical protein